MTGKKTFREVLAERRHFEQVDPTRRTDVSAAGKRPRPMDTRQLVKDMVRNELSTMAEDAEMDTFEEADDFEDEEPEPHWPSAYEIHDMQPDTEMSERSPEPGDELHPVERDQTSSLSENEEQSDE